MSKSIVVFGDSLASGDNNHSKSYIHYLKLDRYHIINNAVSGTTLDNYSIFPVGDNDLLSLADKYKSELKQADAVILSYGFNDILSAALTRTDIVGIIIALSKFVDILGVYNKKARLIFLYPFALFPDNKDMLPITRFVDYVMNYTQLYKLDATGAIREKVLDSAVETYRTLVSYIVSSTNMMAFPIFENSQTYMKYIDEKDTLHPSAEGYKHAAKRLKSILRSALE